MKWWVNVKKNTRVIHTTPTSSLSKKLDINNPGFPGAGNPQVPENF